MSGVATARPDLPKVIWMLWLQGWDDAPEIIKACRQTWTDLNKGWTIRALSFDELNAVLPDERLLALVAEKDLQPEALSDVVRIALLRRYGGVWVDSTCYCLRPLDDWLVDAMPGGFFAFANPGPDRMLSTWFLASDTRNVIVPEWYKLTHTYWLKRTARDHYFWFHYLFADGYARTQSFKNAWDQSQKVPTDGPCYFLPHETRLTGPISTADQAFVDARATPLLKLNHRFGRNKVAKDSVLHHLISRAHTASHNPPNGGF